MWSLFGHRCDPSDVRQGSCPHCGTTWTKVSDLQINISGLKGRDVRDENGERYPLF